jgi:hypothetical protein
MPCAARALIEHSERFLAAVQCGEESLPALLDAREALIRDLGSALSHGLQIGPEELRAIGDLEQAILAALLDQREAVAAEIATLRRGRDAGAAYHPTRDRPAVYLDRAG